MSDESKAAAAAAALGRLRWAGKTAEQRREHALLMLRARWGGRRKAQHKRAKGRAK